MTTTHPIINTPTGEGLFKVISTHYTKFSQALCEFIDDSISGIRAHRDTCSLLSCIDILLDDHGSYVDVMVRDGGPGIANIDKAMTISDNSSPDTVLNEYGIGMKHALASVDSGPSQLWSIQTRTQEDAILDRHKVIRSPYTISGMTWTSEPGKGDIEGDTGTVIQFRCPRPVFRTLLPSAKAEEADFGDLVSILEEELQFTYGGILATGEVWLCITATRMDGSVIKKVLTSPLTPAWLPDTIRRVPTTTVDLGGGPVTIRCTYGSIEGDPDNFLYYKANMASSGVEISINGRVIERGMFSRIFGETLHPSQNRFLAQIDLISEVPGALPSTKTSKTGFREEDPRLSRLFAWIRANVEKPGKDYRSREKRLVDTLMAKKAAEPGVLRVAREEVTYQSLGLRTKIDLFLSREDGVSIYEAKANASKAENLYQLRLYWDGCSADGRPADVGILIAYRHPDEVKRLVAELNRQTDPTGLPYNFRLVTWADEGIDPDAVA